MSPVRCRHPEPRRRCQATGRDRVVSCEFRGRLAQGLARFLDTEEVTGSIPVSPTNENPLRPSGLRDGPPPGQAPHFGEVPGGGLRC